MFNNQTSEAVGFDSSWKTERTSQSIEVQTEDYKSQEQESQTFSKRNVECQTSDNLTIPVTEADVDYEKLAAFLKRVGPKVFKELGKIEKSRASSRFETVSEEFEKNETKKLHTLQAPKVDEKTEMIVSSISWSCSGSSLAFGYCCPNHDNWCDHRSQVVFYNIDRKDFVANVPMKTIETSSCVTQVSFHPVEPSILAVGTFSGEVVVWNLQNDDDLVLGSSSNMAASHKDAVTQVSWVSSADPSQPLSLVTAGRDGQILVWQVKPQLGTFRLSQGFAISVNHGAGGRKVQTPMNGGLDNELGISCFSFMPQERTTFVVGVEGGSILHCSILTNKPASVGSRPNDVPLKDPVLSCYDGHQGSVTGLQCSLADVFISCGIDQEIHVYQSEQPSPLQVIFTDAACLGVCWCPPNDQLFCGWGESGCVDFYRLQEGEAIPSLRLAADDKSPITTLHFNPHSNRLLASGDAKCTASVWEIPSLQAYSNVDLRI